MAAQPRGRPGPRDADGGGGAAPREAPHASLSTSGLFAKDLPSMMYGFGDAEQPLAETVALVEELVCDFIGGVAVAASQHAQQRTGTAKLSTEDVIGVVRKDAARLARAKELVTANEETRKALRVVQTDEKDLAELGK